MKINESAIASVCGVGNKVNKTEQNSCSVDIDQHWRRLVSMQTDRTANMLRAVRQIELARNAINDQLQIIMQSLETNRAELRDAEERFFTCLDRSL